MNTILKRRALTDEAKQTIGAELLGWVERNPGKQIPGQRLAAKFGIARSQITTVTRYLIANGDLERVSRYIYVKPESKTKTHPVPQTAVTINPPKLTPFAEAVAQEAQKFYWEKQNDSLRDFVEYLKKG